MKLSKVLAFGFLCSLCIMCASIAHAQIKSGAITGAVSDVNGASVPGAEVIITNEETNVAQNVQTTDEGTYSVPYLAAGLYSVTVNKSGFAPFKQNRIAIGTSQTARVDAVLTVGSVGETIDVQADGAQLQTEAATVTNAVEESIIKTVPNMNHNPYYFATLQPGVNARGNLNDTQNVNSFGVGVDARRTASAISINGGEAFSNDIQLDGVSVQGSAWNEAAVLPNTEGLREVRTITNNYSAEYGRGQGVITLTTKSGTNDFNGSAFYRIRNEALNANTLVNNVRGLRRNPFKVNTYGGTIGGPILKDRMFFFASYEGLRYKTGLNAFRTVPTALERTGDFSQSFVLVNNVVTPIRLFDPFNVAPVAGQTNRYRRAEISNARIINPNPAALRLLQAFPLPNNLTRPGTDPRLQVDNYYNRVIRTIDRDSINSRIDYTRGKHSIYGTFGFSNGQIITPSAYTGDSPFYSRIEFIAPEVIDKNPYGSIGDTIVLSPTFILDLRYGLTRINTTNETPIDPDFDYAQYGIPAPISNIITIFGAAPSVPSIGPFSALDNSNNLHKRENQTNHLLVLNATKTTGRVNFKFGGEYRVYLLNTRDPEQAVQFRTDNRYTAEFVQGDGVSTPSGITQLANTSGLQAASLLLGVGDLFIKQGRSPLPALAAKYFALYTQNDWKVSDRLTLNLGLRWDLQPGPTDRFDRISGIDLSARNPFGGQGAIAFAGHDGYSRNLWDTTYTDFGPRLGAAYRLTDNTVIRGGYGITYLPSSTGTTGTSGFFGLEAASAFTDPVIFRNNNAVPSGTFDTIYNPATNTGVNRIVQPVGPDQNAAVLYGQSGDTTFKFVRDFKNGRVHQWNFFIEQSIGKFLFSAGYLGTKGTRLPYARISPNSIQNVSQDVLDGFRASYLATRGTNPINERVCNPLQTLQTCNPANPGAATGPLLPFLGVYGTRTLTRQQALIPAPLFANVLLNQSIGYSDYHALQLVASRRLSQGLDFNASYTYSKSLAFGSSEVQSNGFADTSSGGDGNNGFTGGLVDQRNLRNNRSLALTDIPHRFVATFVYDLPFGRGRSFEASNSIVNALVGGFRLAGTYRLNSGAPIQLSGPGEALNSRADRIPGVPVELPKEFQRFYTPTETVVLPSGRTIRPCGGQATPCFLKYNIDAFQGRVARDANGNLIRNAAGTAYLPDLYYYGTSAISYDELRGNSFNNLDLSLDRTFSITERVAFDFSARFSNVLNKTQFRPFINGGLGGVSTLLEANAPNRPATAAANPFNIQPGQLTNQSFGTFGLATYDPRQIEFQFKLRF